MQIRSLAALSALASSFVLPALPALAAPPELANGRFVLLPSLPGSAHTVPHAVNGQAQVVGDSEESGTGTPHAILWPAGGGLEDLARGAHAWGINDHGLIVGNVGATPGWWQQGAWHAVGDYGTNMAVNANDLMGGDYETNLALFTKTGMQLLGGLPWGYRDTAQGLDVAGDEVGTSYLTQGWGIPPTLPHVHLNGQSTVQLPLAGNGNNGSATGINDAGLIVGSTWFVDTNEATTWSCAVRWDSLQPTCLPWATSFSGADGVNADGDIVGWGQAADGQRHAVVWHAGVALDLNDFVPAKWRDAGWVLTEATAINDDGAVAGTLTGPDRITRAWLLTAR